tara:strand:- start:7977 stop:8354 length:378 start_codon:yes stop_codon:yes gene_type:complete
MCAMKKFMFLPLLFLVFCFGCEDRDDNLNAVNLRIKNVSDVTFTRVQVGAADKIHTDISSGAFSDYLEYEESTYRYAYINIMAEGNTYTLQPVDFVGEAVLSIGFYTYELDLTADNSVVLTFVVD